MTRLLVVSRSAALAPRLRDVHDVVEHPVEQVGELAVTQPGDVFVLDLGDPEATLRALETLRGQGSRAPALVLSGYQPAWATLGERNVPGIIIVPVPVTRQSLLAGIDQLTTMTGTTAAATAAARPTATAAARPTATGTAAARPNAAPGIGVSPVNVGAPRPPTPPGLLASPVPASPAPAAPVPASPVPAAAVPLLPAATPPLESVAVPIATPTAEPDPFGFAVPVVAEPVSPVPVIAEPSEPFPVVVATPTSVESLPPPPRHDADDAGPVDRAAAASATAQPAGGDPPSSDADAPVGYAGEPADLAEPAIERPGWVQPGWARPASFEPAARSASAFHPADAEESPPPEIPLAVPEPSPDEANLVALWPPADRFPVPPGTPTPRDDLTPPGGPGADPRPSWQPPTAWGGATTADVPVVDSVLLPVNPDPGERLPDDPAAPAVDDLFPSPQRPFTPSAGAPPPGPFPPPGRGSPLAPPATSPPRTPPIATEDPFWAGQGGRPEVTSGSALQRPAGRRPVADQPVAKGPVPNDMPDQAPVRTASGHADAPDAPDISHADHPPGSSGPPRPEATEQPGGERDHQDEPHRPHSPRRASPLDVPAVWPPPPEDWPTLGSPRRDRLGRSPAPDEQVPDGFDAGRHATDGPTAGGQTPVPDGAPSLDDLAPWHRPAEGSPARSADNTPGEDPTGATTHHRSLLGRGPASPGGGSELAQRLSGRPRASSLGPGGTSAELIALGTGRPVADPRQGQTAPPAAGHDVPGAAAGPAPSPPSRPDHQAPPTPEESPPSSVDEFSATADAFGVAVPAEPGPADPFGTRGPWAPPEPASPRRSPGPLPTPPGARPLAGGIPIAGEASFPVAAPPPANPAGISGTPQPPSGHPLAGAAATSYARPAPTSPYPAPDVAAAPYAVPVPPRTAAYAAPHPYPTGNESEGASPYPAPDRAAAPYAMPSPSGSPTAGEAGPPAEPDLPDLIATLARRSGELFGVSDTAQVLADDLVERAQADAVAVLVPDGEVWRVSGSVGLLLAELGLELNRTHWVVAEIALGGQVLMLQDAAQARPRLAGAPLAMWRHLLAVPVPRVHALAILARGPAAPPFGESDLARVVGPVAEASELLSTAMTTRALARLLLPLAEGTAPDGH